MYAAGVDCMVTVYFRIYKGILVRLNRGVYILYLFLSFALRNMIRISFGKSEFLKAKKNMFFVHTLHFFDVRQNIRSLTGGVYEA